MPLDMIRLTLTYIDKVLVVAYANLLEKIAKRFFICNIKKNSNTSKYFIIL